MQTNNDQNNPIFNKFFKFKEGSLLKPYISKITHKEKLFYTLGEILAIIENVIREEQMYDYRNPSVILCTTELEQALDRKALQSARWYTEQVRGSVLGICTDQSTFLLAYQASNQSRSVPSKRR